MKLIWSDCNGIFSKFPRVEKFEEFLSCIRKKFNTETGRKVFSLCIIGAATRCCRPALSFVLGVLRIHFIFLTVVAASFGPVKRGQCYGSIALPLFHRRSHSPGLCPKRLVNISVWGYYYFSVLYVSIVIS